MTGDQLQFYVKQMDESLQIQDSHIGLIVIATITDNKEHMYIAFHPHMAQCKCNNCKQFVAAIKKLVNDCGEFGEIPQRSTV